MSSRLDYFYKQKVTEAELNLGFELLEQADRNLAADMGLLGVITGAVPVEHAPVADLTIDLTAPARAYDALGQRVAFGTGQRVDCAVDSNGIPTEISTAGQERWLGVFLKFDRLLSDPRTDGNSQQVFFRHDESFQLIVRQGPQAVAGAAPKVPLDESAILLCDVRRRAGQTQVRAADLDLSRRQAFVFVRASATTVVPGSWNTLVPTTPTVQAALDSADSVLSDHLSGTARRHLGTVIDVAPRGFVSSTTVQAAIHELVDKLSAVASGASGAHRVGTDAVPGTPNALATGLVRSQLAQLLGFINAHVAAASGAHPASAIGVIDTGNLLDGNNAEAALQEVAGSHGQDHFRANEANNGQHRTIHQPVLADPTSKALLWDAMGNGGPFMHLRVYADTDSIWFVANAKWNGNAWARAEPGNFAGGFRFSRLDFEIVHDQTDVPTWTTWERRWRLPMSEAFAGSFEAAGAVRDQGRVGVEGTNTHTANRQLTFGASTTFRCRFAQVPSSITLAPIAVSFGFGGTPTVHSITRDGFSIRSFQNVAADSTVFWHGTYTTAI